MIREYIIAPSAIADMKQITDYIAMRSGFAQVDRFLNKANQKFSRIVQFPKIGKQRDDILAGSRSLSFDGYLILYVVLDERIEIVRVVSGYRDLQSLFDSDDGS
jgi:toxin ParE1/3/4